MTLQQLRYILELSKHNSISAAAQALNIAQPSLSAAIKDLETEFALTLVKRNRHGITFTSAGLEFLHYADHILTHAEEMHDHFHPEIGQEASHTLTISSQHYPFADEAFIHALQRISPTSAYTFTLREGVKFHNGESVTAEDVVYSMNRCADNSGDSALVSAFSAIQDLKAVDERTVTFRLEQPDLELINFLSAAIIPQSSEGQTGFIPGTGPFKLVSRSPQENIVMERFDEYWGTPAKVSKVTYQIYEDSTALPSPPGRPPGTGRSAPCRAGISSW